MVDLASEEVSDTGNTRRRKLSSFHRDVSALSATQTTVESKKRSLESCTLLPSHPPFND